MTLRQGFAWWSFAEGRDVGVDLLQGAWEAGMRGIDFLPPELWADARAIGYELITIDGHPSIDDGFDQRSEHPKLLDALRRSIETANTHDVRFVTVASGRRVGVSRRAAIEACADAFASVADLAGDAGVGMLLEPLNTVYDHPDHACDTVAWAREVVDKVGSPSLKVLFDVYHTQIMEGDLINRYRDNRDVIGHIHTAGVPGRAEIGDDQEINYRGFARALREHDYRGWVVHEFLPKGEPAQSLREARAIFDS